MSLTFYTGLFQRLIDVEISWADRFSGSSRRSMNFRNHAQTKNVFFFFFTVCFYFSGKLKKTEKQKMAGNNFIYSALYSKNLCFVWWWGLMHGIFSKWRTINCRILLVKTWSTSLAMLTVVQFLTAINVIDQSAFMALFTPKFAVKFKFFQIM